MSTRTTQKEPIGTEIILACYLRYISGGSYLDIRTVNGISVALFYRCINNYVEAILPCYNIAYNFPTTEGKLIVDVNGFNSNSNNNAIKDCVALIDGYPLRIEVPTAKEIGNAMSFFSGHYHAYGINV
jgi:hypothetical protein